MKVSITILTVLACATLTSAAANTFELRIAGLHDKLHAAWGKVANGKVGTLISQAIKTLKTASLAGPEAGAHAVEKVEALVPSLESLSNGGPATRSNLVSSLAGLVGERHELLGTLLDASAESMQKQGNGPWATILKVAGEWVRNNLLKDENIRNLANKGADALDVIEDALALFNNFSGGMRPVLNMITNAVETLDSASDILLNREKDDDTRNIIVSKLIGMLYNVKNAQNQAAFDAINKVCEKMHTSQAQNS